MGVHLIQNSAALPEIVSINQNSQSRIYISPYITAALQSLAPLIWFVVQFSMRIKHNFIAEIDMTFLKPRQSTTTPEKNPLSQATTNKNCLVSSSPIHQL